MRLFVLAVASLVACSTAAPPPPPAPIEPACLRPQVRLAQTAGVEAPLLANLVTPPAKDPLTPCLVAARTNATGLMARLLDRLAQPPVARRLDDPVSYVELETVERACTMLPEVLAAATTRRDACSPYRKVAPEEPLVILDLAEAATVMARAIARAGDRPRALALLLDAATALDDLARGNVSLAVAYPAATGRRLIAGQLQVVGGDVPIALIDALVAAEPPLASYLDVPCTTERTCLDAIGKRDDPALVKRVRNLAGAIGAMAELRAVLAIGATCPAIETLPVHPLVEIVASETGLTVQTPAWVFSAATPVVRYVVACKR